MKCIKLFAQNNGLEFKALKFRSQTDRYFTGYCLLSPGPGPVLPGGRWLSTNEVLTFEPVRTHTKGLEWCISSNISNHYRGAGLHTVYISGRGIAKHLVNIKDALLHAIEQNS